MIQTRTVGESSFEYEERLLGGEIGNENGIGVESRNRSEVEGGSSLRDFFRGVGNTRPQRDDHH